MNKSKMIRWAEHIAPTGRSGMHAILIRKPEGKKSLGRNRHRWEKKIRIDQRVIGYGGMGWMDLA
jgi:hypothetical protein